VGGQPKDRWDKADILIKAVVPLVSAVVIGLFGFWIKDSVDQAFKRQELEISSAKGMRDLISELRKSDLSEPEAEAASMAMAAFGRPALVPLVNELNIGSTSSQPAAEKALFVVGLAHPDQACELLESVLNNHNRQFSVQAHRSVIRLLGAIGCEEAVDSLVGYRVLVKDDSQATREAYAKMVAGDQVPTVTEVGQVQEDLNDALELLGE